MFCVPLSFRAVYYATLVTGKDSGSEEDHMKQKDMTTILLMSVNFLCQSPMSLRSRGKNNVSMATAMEFTNQA